MHAPSHRPSTFHDTESGRTLLLAGLVQQENPSINPFPAGSRNTLHRMILGFGGTMETDAGRFTETGFSHLWWSRDGGA